LFCNYVESKLKTKLIQIEQSNIVLLHSNQLSKQFAELAYFQILSPIRPCSLLDFSGIPKFWPSN